MQKTKVPIFCICRLPYDKEEYVQFCKYHACYHTGCVKVPEWAVNTKRKWGCQKCKDDIALKPKNILASVHHTTIDRPYPRPRPPPPSSDIKSRYRDLLCKYSFWDIVYGEQITKCTRTFRLRSSNEGEHRWKPSKRQDAAIFLQPSAKSSLTNCT